MRFFACFVKWNNERFVLCSPPLRVHRRLQADVQTIQRQTKKDRTRRSPHKVIHAVYGFPPAGIDYDTRRGTFVFAGFTDFLS